MIDDGYLLLFGVETVDVNGVKAALPQRTVFVNKANIVEVDRAFRYEPRNRSNLFDTDQARLKREADRLLAQV